MLFPRSGRVKTSLLGNISPQGTKPFFVPAPTQGINAQSGLAEMAVNEAIFMYNMIPASYGVKVRTGYREHVTDVGTDGVRTIIPFTGAVGSDNRLFAASSDGIYDVTSSGTSPSVEIAFGSVTDESGIGVSVGFVNDAGAYFALYADEENGYFIYTGAGSSWAKIVAGVGAGELSGIDPDDVVYVTLFKSRVWFVERGSANAYYLPAGQTTGVAVKFNFGNKFKHGGNLVALYNWTVDGGEGVDDYLVAVGSGGDVIVYKGNDPSSSTDWFLHGSWFIGPPPVGRRIAGSFGGELYLLSSYGLLPMSKLMSGTLVQLEEVYITKKITPLVNSEMLASRSEMGWEVRLIPTDNTLLISAPKRDGFPYTQFAYSLNTPGWGVFQAIPYYTGQTWDGNFYIGTEDGRVLLYTGTVDNVSLDESTYTDIEWSLLMSFQDVGAPGTYKRIQFIRPVFAAAQAVECSVESRYDYNLDESLIPPAAPGAIGGALWDDPASLWDLAIWGGEFSITDSVRGGHGMGRALSIGLAGVSSAYTILIRFDLMSDQGWML